jgi:hypothetical protein
MHHLGLRLEQLALETGQHELAMRPGLAGVDGWLARLSESSSSSPNSATKS